jgi:mono/diheme cytochrome c family protein
VSTNDIILAVVCAVLVVFSFTVAIVVPKRHPDFPAGKMAAFFLVSAALVIGMLVSVEVVGEEHEEPEAAEAAPPAEGGEPAPPAEGGEPAPPAEPAPAPAGDAAAGKEIFASAGCADCHTLADAGASGAVGPNLDETRPPPELVVDRVTNGAGAMPSFSGQLSEQQIQDVAAYVVQATSG